MLLLNKKPFYVHIAQPKLINLCTITLPAQRQEGKTTVPLSLEFDGTNYSPIQLSKSHTPKGQPHHYIQGNPITITTAALWNTPGLKATHFFVGYRTTTCSRPAFSSHKEGKRGLGRDKWYPCWSWPWWTKPLLRKSNNYRQMILLLYICVPFFKDIWFFCFNIRSFVLNYLTFFFLFSTLSSFSLTEE